MVWPTFKDSEKWWKKMSIVEYAEKILGLKLYPFQKEFLQKLENLPPSSRLISTPRGMMIVEGEEEEEPGNDIYQLLR